MAWGISNLRDLPQPDWKFLGNRARRKYNSKNYTKIFVIVEYTDIITEIIFFFKITYILLLTKDCYNLDILITFQNDKGEKKILLPASAIVLRCLYKSRVSLCS